MGSRRCWCCSTNPCAFIFDKFLVFIIIIFAHPPQSVGRGPDVSLVREGLVGLILGTHNCCHLASSSSWYLRERDDSWTPLHYINVLGQCVGLAVVAPREGWLQVLWGFVVQGRLREPWARAEQQLLPWFLWHPSPKPTVSLSQKVPWWSSRRAAVLVQPTVVCWAAITTPVATVREGKRDNKNSLTFSLPGIAWLQL